MAFDLSWFSKGSYSRMEDTREHPVPSASSQSQQRSEVFGSEPRETMNASLVMTSLTGNGLNEHKRCDVMTDPGAGNEDTG